MVTRGQGRAPLLRTSRMWWVLAAAQPRRVGDGRARLAVGARPAVHSCGASTSAQCFEEGGRQAEPAEVRVWIYGTWHEVDAIMVHPGGRAPPAWRSTPGLC